MKQARDVMDRNPATVGPESTVEQLGRLLLERNLDGACVVEDGRLVGVATAMDIMFKERKLHLPTFLVFMDAAIPLGESHVREQLRKTLGGRVADVMTQPAITVTPGASLQEVATLMVDKHLTVLPVVEDGKLLGAVTKQAMLRATLEAA
ncbi:MAG: CBS domain-containing protein [Myxococcota bacterium]